MIAFPAKPPAIASGSTATKASAPPTRPLTGRAFAITANTAMHRGTIVRNVISEQSVSSDSSTTMAKGAR